MGTWNVDPYSSDFAIDLRSCIGAVARLPFDPARLLEFVCQLEPDAANDVASPDHTVFWLVVADQFAKKGIDCPAARDRALTFIVDGTDLATMASLGMDEKSLAQRRRMLEELRVRLAEKWTYKRCTVLKAPQKLLMEVGQVMVYPVRRKLVRCSPVEPWVKSWTPDGWSAMVVVERGLLFEFLAWYRPLVAHSALHAEPTLAELTVPHGWELKRPGPMTAGVYSSLQLKSVGYIDIDRSRFDYFFPDRRDPSGPVLSDICISNSLSCRPQDSTDRFWDIGERSQPGLRALSDIQASAEVPDAWSLCGRWQGVYCTDDDNRSRTSFIATFNEIAGLLRGRIDDMAVGTDLPDRPLEAVIHGRRRERTLRFVKQYLSASKRYVPSVYEGDVSEDGDAIEGRWSRRAVVGAAPIPKLQGSFVMSRMRR